jgi:hypothetical protein
MRAISARDVLVLIGWAATIALLTMITEYAKTPRPGSYGTSFDALDLAIVLATSLVFGIFLVDPVKIIYGFLGVVPLSIVISVISSALYDLYVLGLGELFSETALGWEWELVTWLAFLRVFRIIFPAGVILGFIGAMIGGIASDFIWPHRG